MSDETWVIVSDRNPAARACAGQQPIHPLHRQKSGDLQTTGVAQRNSE